MEHLTADLLLVTLQRFILSVLAEQSTNLIYDNNDAQLLAVIILYHIKSFLKKSP